MVFRRNNEHQAQLLSSNKIYENLIADNDVFEKILKVFGQTDIHIKTVKENMIRQKKLKMMEIALR